MEVLMEDITQHRAWDRMVIGIDIMIALLVEKLLLIKEQLIFYSIEEEMSMLLLLNHLLSYLKRRLLPEVLKQVAQLKKKINKAIKSQTKIFMN